MADSSAESTSNLVEDVASWQGVDLARAFRALEAWARRAPEHQRSRLAIRAIERIDSEPAFSEAERSSRIGRLLATLQLSEAGQRKLAENARGFSASAKNGIATGLLPHIRPSVYSAITPRRIGVTPPAPAPPPTGTPVDPDGQISEGCLVLVLSQSDIDATKALLKHRGLSALRVQSRKELLTHLQSSDICAILIESSFLEGLSLEEQEDALKQIASYSTFAWLRVCERTLSPTFKIEEIFKDARCAGSLGSDTFSLRNEDGLVEREVSHLEKAAAILNPNKCQWLPEDIEEPELNCLIGSLRRYITERQGGRQLEILSLKTRFLPGGRTFSKVFRVSIGSQGLPVVAKVGAQLQIRDEYRRFRQFISIWDRGLYPHFDYHAGVGVIIFGLVGDVGKDISPAPTLESRLNSLWWRELYDATQDVPKAEELSEAILDAAKKLARLNETKFTDADWESFANHSSR